MNAVASGEILLPLALGDCPDDAIRHAGALASATASRLVGLVSISLAAPVAEAWAYYPADTYETLAGAASATVDAFVAEARERFAGLGVPFEIRGSRSFWLTPGEDAALHARHADFIVLGIRRPVRDDTVHLFSSILLGSGRPLLVVPEGTGVLPWHDDRMRHAVVAWKSTKEAARALHDALPMLQEATHVDMLTVRRDARATPERPDPEVQLAHLRRHGIRAERVEREANGQPVSQRILQHVVTSNAGLVVAGGYSRTRARQWLLGGVTRALLEQCSAPILFSH